MFVLWRQFARGHNRDQAMKPPEIILVCGGRDYNDREFFYKTMDSAKPFFAEECCIVHGNARGADRLAYVWAFERGCAQMAMPANWYTFDKKAGTLRNRWMLKFAKPELVIAFSGGSGTANMVAISRLSNIPVWEPK